MNWDAFLEAEAESFDELLPHFGVQEWGDLLDELAEANDHDLDDATAMCLRDEKDEDVYVGRDNVAEMLQVTQQEVVEALHDTLDRLKVESALPIIVPAARSLDSQIYVFKHGEEHLTENFLPKFEAEDVNSLLQNFEEYVHRLLLVFVCLIKRQVGQVRQDREPEAFLYTQDQLLL